MKELLNNDTKDKIIKDIFQIYNESKKAEIFTPIETVEKMRDIIENAFLNHCDLTYDVKDEKTKNVVETAFLNHCDLTYDVGDEEIEEIHVISYECFEEAVEEIINKIFKIKYYENRNF